MVHYPTGACSVTRSELKFRINLRHMLASEHPNLPPLLPLVLSRTWLLCDTGAVVRHGIYAGRRRGSDRFPLGRDGPWRSKVALVFSHDLNGYLGPVLAVGSYDKTRWKRHMNNTIGIDVSKDTLDVHRLADGQHKQFLNGKAGHAHLIKWVRMQPDRLVIFEATGAYHRLLERALGTHAIPFVKVNPKQARRFAQASGKLAKTDRVDCEMLAKMGAALQLVPKPIDEENLYDLRELLSTRRALIKDRTAAKARSATVTHVLVKQQLARRLRQIECDIAKIDAAMLELAHQDQQMTERLEILASIPGIGMRTALMILVDMPEIGKLDSKRVASLAGLAPMS